MAKMGSVDKIAEESHQLRSEMVKVSLLTLSLAIASKRNLITKQTYNTSDKAENDVKLSTRRRSPMGRATNIPRKVIVKARK